MVRASKFLTEEEKSAIARAIGEAEKKTTAEIVPVVATRSGRYDRAEDVVGVVVGLIAVAAVWLLFQKVEAVGEEWGTAHRCSVSLIAILGTFTIGFIVGTFAATAVPALAYPLIGRREKEEEVERSARRAFVEFQVRRTVGGTGILIYVSLFERMVWVLGDTAIGQKLSQSHWDEVRDLIVDGLRRRRPAEGLQSAIARCGELLAEHFPLAPGDVNEIANELRLID
jgi:putative membrane protein